MAGKQKKPDIKAIRYHELENYRQGGGQGPQDQKPQNLWSVLNSKVSDLTVQFRTKARNKLRPEIFSLENEFKNSAGLKHQKATEAKVRLDRLNNRFNTIARGGIEGAFVAAKVLWLQSQRNPQNPSL